MLVELCFIYPLVICMFMALAGFKSKSTSTKNFLVGLLSKTKGLNSMQSWHKRKIGFCIFSRSKKSTTSMAKVCLFNGGSMGFFTPRKPIMGIARMSPNNARLGPVGFGGGERAYGFCGDT